MFLSFELSSRIFSSNFVIAVFVIKTVINLMAINEAKGTNVSSLVGN